MSGSQIEINLCPDCPLRENPFRREVHGDFEGASELHDTIMWARGGRTLYTGTLGTLWQRTKRISVGEMPSRDWLPGPQSDFIILKAAEKAAFCEGPTTELSKGPKFPDIIRRLIGKKTVKKTVKCCGCFELLDER